MKTGWVSFDCFGTLVDWNTGVLELRYHDIAPARTLGIQRVWLDRDKTGHDEHAVSARVESATEVVQVVRQLFENAA